MNTNTRRQRRLARIAAHDCEILAQLADRLNRRPLRLRTGSKLDIAGRYLRRFYNVLPWHRGARHIGRENFGPMLYQTGKADAGADAALAVDGRAAL